MVLRTAVLAAALGALSADGLTRSVGSQLSKTTFSLDMEPEEAADFLLGAEMEWESEAAVCSRLSASQENPECAMVPAKFTSSCSSVVSTLIQGSGKQKLMFRKRLQQQRKKYLDSICGSDILDGPHKSRCQHLAESVTTLMIDHSSEEEIQKEVTEVCGKMWAEVANEAAASQIEQDKLAVAQARKEAAKKVDEVKSKAKVQSDEVSKLQAKLAEAQQKLGAEKTAKEDAQAKLEAKSKTAADLETQLTGTQAKLQAASAKLNEAADKETAEEGETLAKAAEVQSLEAKVKAKEAKLAVEAKEVAKLESKVKNTEGKLGVAITIAEKEAKAEKDAEAEAKAAEEAKIKAEEGKVQAEEANLQKMGANSTQKKNTTKHVVLPTNRSQDVASVKGAIAKVQQVLANATKVSTTDTVAKANKTGVSTQFEANLWSNLEAAKVVAQNNANFVMKEAVAKHEADDDKEDTDYSHH